MADYRTIEIDFDVHKRIEAERKSFAEAPNAVLRRLIGIGAAPSQAPAPVNGGSGNGRRAWSGKGVILPHGTELQMDYNGRHHTGIIENGEWLVEAKRFKSPSASAGGVATTKDGNRTSLDGWIYWRVKRPGDTGWIAIKQLLRPKKILSIDDL